MTGQIDPPNRLKSNHTTVWLVVGASLFLGVCLIGLGGLVYGAWQFLLPVVFATHPIDPGCTDYPCLEVCLQGLPDIVGALDPGTPDPTEAFELHDSSNPGGAYDLATYRVTGNEIKLTLAPAVPERLKKYQQDTGLHQRIWDFFVTLIPKSARDRLTHFTIYTDGPEGKSAAQIRYAPPDYFLNVDIFDLGDPEALTSSLVHETGHLITLNADQIVGAEIHFVDTPDLESYQVTQKKCGYLFFSGWCALPEAYINLFYERFWQGRHDDTLYRLYYAQYKSGEDYDRIGRQLFSDYPDEFLSDHAALNISEDIAVSFEHFVLWPMPAGNRIADQKALFFYEFPELVELREQIIQGTCDYAANH
jgi:hypothetical protein